MISNKVLLEQFKLTDIYLDLHDYQNMTQKKLSHKIPKWEKIVGPKYSFHQGSNDIEPRLYLLSEGLYEFGQHLKKYCKRCDKKLYFVYDTIRDWRGHLRPFKYCNKQFWKSYRANLKILLSNAKEHYLATKIEHENALKVHKAEHQNTSVACECGGKYAIRNKLKHFATQKHKKFCAPTGTDC
jgi:hypothetical protein